MGFKSAFLLIIVYTFCAAAALEQRTAVCISGLERSVERDIEHRAIGGNAADYFRCGTLPKEVYPIRGVIGVLTAAESVRRFLYPTLGANVDIFQYRPTSANGVLHGHDDAASTTEPLSCALFAPLPGTGNMFCNITEEERYSSDAYDPIPNFYYVKRDQNPQLVDSFIHQLIGVQRCWEMIKNHSAVTGTTYDWVVRTRPDVGFWMPLPFQNIRELPMHTLNVAYRGHGGCEDSFGIMSWSVATAFFDRHKLMLKNGVSHGVPFEHALGCRAIHESVWDPEDFARCAVERAGFNVSYTPRVGYFVYRPGVSTRARGGAR